MPLGGDADAGERPAFGELLAQVLEGEADAPLRHAGGEQALGGAQQDDVLEGEVVLAPWALPRREEAGTDVGADLAGREAEQGRDVLGRVAAGGSRTLHCARRTEGGGPVHRPQCTADSYLFELFFFAVSTAGAGSASRGDRRAGLRSASDTGAGAAGAWPVAARLALNSVVWP